jgi:hypothetical protein
MRADGWTAVADALEAVTSLTSLNGCVQCRAIRAGGQTKLLLRGTELGVWASRYLPQSASTLKVLDIRHALSLSVSLSVCLSLCLSLSLALSLSL